MPAKGKRKVKLTTRIVVEEARGEAPDRTATAPLPVSETFVPPADAETMPCWFTPAYGSQGTAGPAGTVNTTQPGVPIHVVWTFRRRGSYRTLRASKLFQFPALLPRGSVIWLPESHGIPEGRDGRLCVGSYEWQAGSDLRCRISPTWDVDNLETWRQWLRSRGWSCQLMVPSGASCD